MYQRERQQEQFYNLEIPSVMLLHPDTSLLSTVCFSREAANTSYYSFWFNDNHFVYHRCS